MSDNLNWRVEAACLNAWPAPRQIFLDGWLLRSSGGSTRRANSANPVHAGAETSTAFIDRAEAFYAAQGRPAIFRVPELVGVIDPLLAQRGYALDAPTRTLFAELDGLASTDCPAVRIASAPTRQWLAARDRLSGSDKAASLACRAIIASILLPCAYVAMLERGRIVALAFGVRQGDLLIVESVITDPACRRRGLAAQCLSRLIGWAKEEGGRAAALQVVADNEAALALYDRLGFRRDLYRYHYRVKR